MKNPLLEVLSAAPFALAVQAVHAGQPALQTRPDPKAPTYEETRAKQSLGRVIASPTGSSYWLGDLAKPDSGSPGAGNSGSSANVLANSPLNKRPLTFH